MNQNINILRQIYPFPEHKPDFKSFYWSLDGGGREIIADLIVQKNISLMLEIGVFFGGSVKQWLDTSPNMTVIGVDTFPSFSNYFTKNYERYQKQIDLGEHTYESLLAQLNRENGTYLSAIANLWDYRSRFVPIKDNSPGILARLKELDIVPELIYLDGDRQLAELPIIEELFPNAIVTGNSWNWNRDNFFPVQERVQQFAQQHNYEIQTSQNSWILQQKVEPVSASPSVNLDARVESELNKPQPLELDCIQPRNGLGEIGQQLAAKPCKIAYLGASVTAQKQGYRSALHYQLCQHYQQPHVEINGAIGGVISGAAVFLMDDTILQYKPDICFVEYSTIDMAWNDRQIVPAIEGMVRKLRAIDCQICFLYLYRTKQEFAKFNQVISWHEEVAEFYGIPSINVGRYVEDGLKRQKFQFRQLFKDFVHNTPEGGWLVAQFIFKGLQEILQNSDSQAPIEASKRKYLHSDLYLKGRMFPIKDSMVRDENNYQVEYFADDDSGKRYKYFKLDESNQLEFEIVGKLVAVLAIVGRESGIVEFVTPEGTFEYNFWDKYCHYQRLNARVIDLDFNRETKVKVRLTERPVDYSTCRRTIKNPEAIDKSFKVIGFLVCGEVFAPPVKTPQMR